MSKVAMAVLTATLAASPVFARDDMDTLLRAQTACASHVTVQFSSAPPAPAMWAPGWEGCSEIEARVRARYPMLPAEQAEADQAKRDREAYDLAVTVIKASKP